MAEKAPDEIAHSDYETFWNSSYMKSIRRQMISGELPKECSICKVPNKVDSHKDGFRHYFRSHFKKIRNATAMDGTTSYSLRFLDYRNNSCNLICKFCGPESSSSWMRQGLKADLDWQPFLHSDHAQKVADSIKKSKYETEFLRLVRTHPIEKLYFAGGEPLLSALHFQVLDFLVSSGRSRHVSLSYNTNLNLPSNLISKWLEKLRHFEQVEIYCSIDGSRHVTEYIRTNMDFELFETNLELLKQFENTKPNFIYRLDVTMTSLFLLDLKEFSEMAIQKQVGVDAKLMLGYADRSAFLRCEVLPKNIRERLIDDWMKYFNSLSLKDASLLVKMKDNLELAKNAAEFAPELMRQSVVQSQINDKAFKPAIPFDSFLSRDSEVAQWWERLKESPN